MTLAPSNIMSYTVSLSLGSLHLVSVSPKATFGLGYYTDIVFIFLLPIVSQSTSLSYSYNSFMYSRCVKYAVASLLRC